MIRNLLFHCYPVHGSIWPWHASQLVKYSDAWNGRKIVVIVTDGSTSPPEDVIRVFAPVKAEFFVTRNQAYLAETLHFVEMLSLLKSLDPNEATFYAHAKGVTRTGSLLEAVKSWSELMYTLNLHRPSLIERKLASFAAVGCLRMKIRHAGAEWCYPGSFFWLRHDVLFSRNWRDIEQERYGVEGYPGRHILFEESCSLNPEVIEPVRLYDGYVTDDLIEAWRKRIVEEDLSCTRP